VNNGGNKLAEEREGAYAPRAGGWGKEGGRELWAGRIPKNFYGCQSPFFKKVTDTVLGGELGIVDMGSIIGEQQENLEIERVQKVYKTG
jgi:hypothetical protein